jgi:Protein of unknown function (DUF3800)
MRDSLNTAQSRDSRFLAFFDECGDHSLERIDPDFPVFVLALVVVERATYRDQILPAFNAFKLRYFNHEGINLHSRDIRQSRGPFLLLRNPMLRPAFMEELTRIVEQTPFTLFISAIQKQVHLQRSAGNAANPYDLALEFTMERLVHFLEDEKEKTLPIVAEARGRSEDNALENVFYRIMSLGTSSRPAQEFRRLDCWLTFQPKTNNIVGTQVADLCAYPCARHILNPARSNRPFEVVRKKIYERNGVSGWKVFP